jgi:hypothetical protein
MSKARQRALHKALDAMRKPDARLVRQHGSKGGAAFFILVPHNSFKVTDEIAGEILALENVQPWDAGLPGIGGPQSWRLNTTAAEAR